MQAALQPFGAPCSNRWCHSLSIMHLSTLQSTLEKLLLNHQLEQCIESQPYRPTTYSFHNHVMYIQGPGCQKKKKIVFKLCPPLLLPFTHQRIQTPGSIPTPWHYHHAPGPPSTPKCHTDVTIQNRCLSAKYMEKPTGQGQ